MDNFAITEDGGVLTFKKSPDFEDKDSYTVTVTANDGDLETVTITITNVEEGAAVTVGPPQPQVGRMAMASVEDMDGGEMDEMWTWARSSDMMEWTPIDGGHFGRLHPWERGREHVPAGDGELHRRREGRG